MERDKHEAEIEGNGDKAEKGDIWKIGPGFTKEGKEERERERERKETRTVEGKDDFRVN